MAQYLVAQTHDIAFASLNVITPQPHSPGVQIVQRNLAVSGKAKDIGLWIPLQWRIIGTPTVYSTLLGLFGLSGSVTEAEVTIWCPDRLFTFNRFNGLAMLPVPNDDVQRNNYFIRDLTIIVKNMVAL